MDIQNLSTFYLLTIMVMFLNLDSDDVTGILENLCSIIRRAFTERNIIYR